MHLLDFNKRCFKLNYVFLELLYTLWGFFGVCVIIVFRKGVTKFEFYQVQPDELLSYALDPVTGVCMSVCVPIVLCLGLLMLLLSPNRRRQRRPGHNRADLDGEVRCVYVSMCVCKV